MTSRAFREIVLGAIARVGNIDPTQLNDDVNLVDLGFDSLDLSSILVEIEDGVGQEVPPDILDALIDLGELTTIEHVLQGLEPWAAMFAADR
jgi:acyl carrier protein